MNLSQLRFASALASTSSFTAAAAQCCVTQPTLSNGIAQLEQELGERMFIRTTRKVGLTAFGTHVLPYVLEVLSAQGNLLQQAQVFKNPDKRLIRIGTSPLVSANLVALMLEPYRRSNPEIDIVLREMNMADLYRMLEAGLLDFVIGVANVEKGPWLTTFLYQEPLLFIPRGASWPDSRRKQTVQLSEISEETYVMVPDACGLSRTVRALFRRHRRKLHEYSGEAMSYQVLEEWAALGIGAAILPKSKLTGSRHLSFPIADKLDKKVMISFEASWSRTGVQPPHLIEFSKHLRKVVPALIAGLEANSKK